MTKWCTAKARCIGKMAGDEWQKFANLRLLFGYMFTQPGKKLLFMGGEIGQWSEWNHDGSVDWHALGFPQHQGMQRWVRDLNTFYRSEPALYECDFYPEGWRWIDADDSDHSVLTYMRCGRTRPAPVVWPATSRRCRGAAIASACRTKDTGASC